MVGSRSPRRTTTLTALAVTCLLVVVLHIWMDPLPFLLPSAWTADAEVPVRAVPGRTGGQVPGFMILDNVWIVDRTFYIPERLDGVSAHMISSDPFKVEIGSMGDPSTADIRLDGLTLLFNEAGFHFMWHYYHFVTEDLLGGLAALAATPRAHRRNLISSNAESDPLPARLAIPWEPGWRDRWGMNNVVVKAMFGANVIDSDQWTTMTAGNKTVFLPQVLIVDRWASQNHNKLAQDWNKMALPVYAQAKPKGFFDPARQKVFKSLGIAKPSDPIPVIVYIDRQSTERRMSQESQYALLALGESMQARGVIRWKHVILEDLTPEQQIEIVSDASVLLGIHGNGMTHLVWMPEGSTVIELFPYDSFIRDYQCVAEVLGFNYFAIQNDSVLLREEWSRHIGELNPKTLHNGTEIPLHVPFLEDILSIIL
ncbi:hypothetical protein BD324DRAFT_81109 [Kockovaella imperatae]|uniref:Glycosyltransferase 61 catalytic domain-containing protein n=1 Tax=Kockovaella imperatae TaxID=4999 RepID=A0A1Y1UCT0_9TREE|nr:hypothetical protein BD324DRAFT_81109 [Kockovaella imperatae]ORX35809.1 hypothetical protein BD324DRAFT_81109 [Kockovaella imperatae]